MPTQGLLGSAPPSDFPSVSILGALLDPMSAYSNAGLGYPCGLTLYVCSLGARNAAGSTNGAFGDGGSINAPLSSVATAMTSLQNRQNKGDRIVCLPGHVETINAADFMSNTGTASGFSVIGWGTGTLRPTFNWTAAGSTWLFDTAGVVLYNLYLNFCKTAAVTVAAPITVSAANCGILKCFIQANALVDQLSTIGITTTAAGDDFVFAGNNVDGGDNNGLSTTFLRLVGADRAYIGGNKIVCATSSNTVGPIQCLTTASLNVQIVNNYVQNAKASSTAAITGMAGLTGDIAGNLCRVMGSTTVSGADNVVNTPGSAQMFNNYGVDGDALLGVVTGTAAT